MFFRTKFKNKLIRPNLRANRRVGDIHASKTLPPVLNLKKQKQLYISFSVVGGLIFLTAIGWFIYGTFIKAEKAVFYPTSCLGGWENPQNAEGKPDLDEGAAAEDYNSKNSAILKNAISELYCGGFEGSVPQDAEPKRAVLKFSWALRLPETKLPEIPAQSENINPPAEDNNQEPESTDEEQENKNQESPESAQPENSTIRIINTAYAQEETTVDSTSPDAPDSSNPSDVPDSPNIPNVPAPTGEIQGENSEQSAGVENAPTGTDMIPGPETPSPDTQNDTRITSLPIQPSEEFLEILYTLDGANWKSLGKANYFSWQNLEYEIPNFSWDDVSKIQFALKSTPLIDAQSTIFLDGLWIEIEYANFEEEGDNEVRETSLLFGTLPDFDKDNFMLDSKPKHNCASQPFGLSLSKNSKARSLINLNPSSKIKPFRVVLGDLPHGVTGTIRRAKDKDYQLELEIKANGNPQKGSFGVVIVYDELLKRKLFSSNTVSTTACQFNLIIN